MNAKEGIAFLAENQEDFAQLLAEIKVDLGDKKAADLTPYNFAEKCGPANQKRHEDSLRQSVTKFSEMASVIREIVERKDKILTHFEATRRYISQLEVPPDLEETVQQMLNSEAELQTKQSNLEAFRGQYQIGDQALADLISEEGKVDDEFFATFARVMSNIELQQMVANEDFIIISANQKQTDRIVYENTYQAAKRLAMRKLNTHFEKNFQNIIFSGQNLQNHLPFLALNPEKDLVKINQKVAHLLATNLRQVLDTSAKTTRKAIISSFGDIGLAMDFSFVFVLEFTSNLFKKYSKNEVYFHSNIEELFGVAIGFIQSGVQAYTAQTSFKLEPLIIPETIIRLRSNIKSRRPKGLHFSCEKTLETRIDDLLEHFKKVAGSHFDKLFAIRNFDTFKEQIFHAVLQFMGVFQYPHLTKNEQFLAVIWDNLERANNHFSNRPEWRRFVSENLSWLTPPGEEKISRS